MNKNLTDITILLDRSGSMGSVLESTIKGYNTFLAKQKELPGQATFSLVQFDDIIEHPLTAVPIQSVPELTANSFIPRGMTAYWKAICRTVDATGRRLASMPEAERPAKVIFVVITDGLENASGSDYPASKVNQMVSHQREKYNWEFVFIGANLDAIKEAEKIGIPKYSTLNYSASDEGTTIAFASLTRSMSNYRLSSAPSAKCAFTNEDQEHQNNLINKTKITTS